MLQNFFIKVRQHPAWYAVLLPLWVLLSFALVQVVVGGILALMVHAGVSFAGVNQAVVSTVIGSIVYVLTIIMVIGFPWALKKYRTTKADLGLTRLPAWLDILLAPAGFLVYLLLSGLLLLFATHVLTFVDINQVQDTGFDQVYEKYQYILAFLTLVVIAPVAEEILFRGYLFGKLMKHVPIWVAILITSAIFAFVHGAWNVGIDVFALSIVLCLLRVVSKSLWPSILLHMIKNGVAFYFLFINPMLLGTLGG